jgi:hypothetical protein
VSHSPSLSVCNNINVVVNSGQTELALALVNGVVTARAGDAAIVERAAGLPGKFTTTASP